MLSVAGWRQFPYVVHVGVFNEQCGRRGGYRYLQSVPLRMEEDTGEASWEAGVIRFPGGYARSLRQSRILI